MASLDRYAWRVTVVALILTVSPLGPTPSALAAFLDPATATATFTAGTLQPPTGLSVGLCLVGSATASWTASGGTVTPTGYEVQWKKSTVGTYANSATTASTSFVITGLSILTTYNVRVRAYFGANWTSTFAGPVSVTCAL